MTSLSTKLKTFALLCTGLCSGSLIAQSSNFVHLQNVSASEREQNAEFGKAVAIHGDYNIIFKCTLPNAPQNAGNAYVHTFS